MLQLSPVHRLASCSVLQTAPHLCISNPVPPPNARVNPNITFTNQHFCRNPACVSRNPFARVLLLSDDHLSRTLAILSQHNLVLNHIHTSQPPHSSVRLLPPPPVRRTVTFVDHNPIFSRPTPLLYSTSLWCPYTFLSVFADRQSLPLYQAFHILQFQTSRLVTAVHFGTCPLVAPYLGVPPQTQLWARDMVFRRRRRTFLHVHQILSPLIQNYVGDMTAPPGQDNSVKSA